MARPSASPSDAVSPELGRVLRAWTTLTTELREAIWGSWTDREDRELPPHPLGGHPSRSCRSNAQRCGRWIARRAPRRVFVSHGCRFALLPRRRCRVDSLLRLTIRFLTRHFGTVPFLSAQELSVHVARRVANRGERVGATWLGGRRNCPASRRIMGYAELISTGSLRSGLAATYRNRLPIPLPRQTPARPGNDQDKRRDGYVRSSGDEESRRWNASAIAGLCRFSSRSSSPQISSWCR